MNIRFASLLLLACVWAPLATVQAEKRTFIDQTGRALEGELVSVAGDNVTIKRTSDGQSFTVKAANFSQADQAYFVSKGGTPATAVVATGAGAKPAPVVGSTSANTAPMRMEVKVYPNKNDRPTNVYWDERTSKVGFRVDVRNGEQQRPFNGGKATMIAFAKDLQDPSQSKIVSREEFDVTLEPLKSLTHDTKEVKLTYDNILSKFGFKYSGYLCVLRDQAGKLVSVVGSSTTVEKFAEDALKLAVNDLFDKSFKKIE